jgi:type II secretory pathway pseudopilin PulG
VNRKEPRYGTVLICVLACLGIVIALVLSMIQSSLRGRHEVRMQRQLLQTELLCEAGVQRAVHKYSSSRDYVGERWSPKLGIPSFQYVAVEIRIKPTSSGASQIQAEVVASLASSEDSNDRMQRSHTFTIPNLDSPSESEFKP